MEIGLRGATPRDLDLLLSINADAYRPYVEQIWGWDDGFQRRYFEEHVVYEKVDIIQVGGEPVGFVSVERLGESIFIESLAILAEYRSRGIGTEIMRGLIREAGEKRIPLHLQVFKVNARAAALYERLGFERWGETETHWKYTLPIRRTDSAD